MTDEVRASYCIAGGGIAGLVLAHRLAQSGKKVVVLEQGPRVTEDDRFDMLLNSKETLNDFADYNDKVEASSVTPHTSAEAEGDTVDWAAQRLFGLGGTALHFEGLMLRPREDDLRVKTLYGRGRDWPIGYSELEPWLLRAEHEVGVSANEDNPYASARSGPFPMPGHAFSYFDREILGPALSRLGMTGHTCPRAVSSVPYRGRSECMACRICKFCPSGARYSPDRVHLPLIEELPNVSVIEDVSLRKLETASGGDRIVAAHALKTKSEEAIVVTAESYILAMGGVETPRALMLSADDGKHKSGLGNMGGQLGRSFSDHLNPYVTYELDRHVGARLGFETMNCDHFRANVDRSEQPGFVIFAAPAMDWFPVGIEATAWATQGNVLSLEELRESIPRMVTLATMTELEGNGVIELDSEQLDAFGSPVAKITMRLSEWDRRGSDILKTVAPKIGDAMGARHVSEVTPAGFGLGYHPSGSTAMAKTPDEGVCDTDLRVFGLDNLYLVSNSVFPHMGPNPPTLIIVALALRLAARLEGGAGK